MLHYYVVQYAGVIPFVAPLSCFSKHFVASLSCFGSLHAMFVLCSGSLTATNEITPACYLQHVSMLHYYVVQ